MKVIVGQNYTNHINKNMYSTRNYIQQRNKRLYKLVFWIMNNTLFWSEIKVESHLVEFICKVFTARVQQFLISLKSDLRGNKL